LETEISAIFPITLVFSVRNLTLSCFWPASPKIHLVRFDLTPMHDYALLSGMIGLLPPVRGASPVPIRLPGIVRHVP
jgi:hypothetical protein